MERLVLTTLIVMGVIQLHKLVGSEDFDAETRLSEVAMMLTSLQRAVQGKSIRSQSAPEANFGPA